MTPLTLSLKYHGLGNDCLVCHRDVAEQLSNEHIQKCCAIATMAWDRMVC